MSSADTEAMGSKIAKVPNTVKYIIKERSAEIISGDSVFYNPVQEFNRDLSIAVLNVFSRQLQKERLEKELKRRNKNNDAKEEVLNEFTKQHVAGAKCDDGMRILEALAATGLRSIRYAKEIAGVREIIANDLSSCAAESINTNVKHNNVEDIVKSSHADAIILMHQSTLPEKRFDAVDLDPYGSPNLFLDSAVKCLADGGLLLVTATDMAVLAGNPPEACFLKYGTASLRIKSCHEFALRILLHTLEVNANRHGKFIEPLLSISADFYIRVFVRVHCGAVKCKFSMSKQSLVYNCIGCDTFTLHQLGSVIPVPTEADPKKVKFGYTPGPPVGTTCSHCGFRYHIGGPIWSAPIHNKAFVDELLAALENEPLNNFGTQKRLIGVLSVVSEELMDVPLYYALDKLCRVLKLEVIPILKFRSALLHAGYRVSYSHALKNSIKTDAPIGVLWDILRCWRKDHPVKESHFMDGSALKAIFSKPCEKEYELKTIHPDANPISRKKALSRFQENPTPHWGPGTRATIMVGDGKLPKCHRNQNKKRKRDNNQTHGNTVGNDMNNVDECTKNKGVKLEE